MSRPELFSLCHSQHSMSPEYFYHQHDLPHGQWCSRPHLGFNFLSLTASDCWTSHSHIIMTHHRTDSDCNTQYMISAD